VTIRQRKQRDSALTPIFTMTHRTAAGGEETSPGPGKLRVVHKQIPQLPPRPDATVLSDSIPLFFIGRNAGGFWVAHESEGRCGGLFLLRRSALRYARRQSAPAGCATMFLTAPLELDVPNQGSRLVGPCAAMLEAAERRAPALLSFFAMAAAEWRKLVAQISHALAGERRNREAIEKDLFRGQYTLVSKNDDDLPVP
jgi:hypothetical protein